MTTENHLGAIWKQDPHKVSDLITKIQAANFGNNIDTMLSQFPTLEFDDERDYTWELSSPAVENIGLVEAKIDGTAVGVTDEAGKNFSEFELVFPRDYFDDTQVIVGGKKRTVSYLSYR